MAKPPYDQDHQQQTQHWQWHSNSSDVLLESQLEQIRSLGRIESKVEPIPEMRNRIEGNTQRITRVEDKLQGLEGKLDLHLETCTPRAGRRKLLSADALKENWTVVLLVVQLTAFLALQLVGQPDKAQRVWGSSPSFRHGEKEQD